MIRVFELNRGMFRVELQTDILESLEHLVSVSPYTSEQILAVLLLSVLRLDDNNVLVGRIKDELESKDG